MLSDISVFLRGSCRFRASGDFPERFLNLCARADLGLWDIAREENSISACIIAGRYRRLLPYARRCGVKLKVCGRFGLPFRLIPYRRRPGMLLGFLLFCGTIWFLSLFIWSVKLPVLSPDTGEKVSAALEDMGVSVGSLRSEVDGNRMSIELQLRVPELTWAGISTYGSSVTVEAKEYEPASGPVKPGDPCNLIASSDGIILDVEPLRGSVEVQPGCAVVKGDLLVSGVVEHLDGTLQITDACAKVWASTHHELTCTIPFRQLVSRRTGRVITRHRVRIFGLELPLLMSIKTDGLYDREYSEFHLSVGSMELPFEVQTEKNYELAEECVVFSHAEAEALAMEELECRVNKMNFDEVLDRKVSVSQNDSGVTVTMALTARENIADAVPIGMQ